MPPNRARFDVWPAPTPNLSPWVVATVLSTLREHERGAFYSSALLAQAMDRNPRIRSALNTRVLGVAGLPFEVQASTRGRNGQRARLAQRRIESLWSAIAPEGVFEQLLRWELLLGVAFAEVVWETTARGWLPRLYAVHPYHVRWDAFLARWQITTKSGLKTIEPGDPGWLVLARGEQDPWMGGAIRCLGIEDAIRHYGIRDWARRGEIHGVPILKGMVPQKADEDAKDDFASDLADAGSEGVLLLPQGATPEASWDAEILEPHDTKGELFSELIQLVDTDVAIAILGQNLTQETKGGSLAAAKVHDRVRQDYLEADARLLARAAREICARWVYYNLGADPDEEAVDGPSGDPWEAALAAAPTPTWDPTPPEDAEGRARANNLDADYLTKLRALEVDLAPLLKARGLTRVETQAPAVTQASTDDTSKSTP